MDLYQQVNGFTNTDMEDFKSGDVDRMIPLYVRSSKPLSMGEVNNFCSKRNLPKI